MHGQHPNYPRQLRQYAKRPSGFPYGGAKQKMKEARKNLARFLWSNAVLQEVE